MGLETDSREPGGGMTTMAAGQLSPSIELAMDWAWAAARHRTVPDAGSPATGNSNTESQPSIGPADLLVGTLLAHPDEDGEARVLLHHFGLTARDVLPLGYPKFSVTDLRREGAGVQRDVSHPMDEEAESVLAAAASLAGGRVSLRYLLGALLVEEVSLRWRASLAARGADVVAVRQSYDRWLRAERKGGSDVAGRRLRRWLERENPRRPVDMPRYAPDRIDGQRDHIGIATEADAFARLIVSCDLTPPLAIALFGDWGSGKSFLMRAVQDRIAALTNRVADRPQSDTDVWKRIRQIEFNAWEYVQGNLWASLLENIFGQLGSMQLRLVDSWRAPVQQQLEAAQQGMADSEQRVAAARMHVESREMEVQQAEQAATAAREQSKAVAADEQRRQAEEQARKALKRFWGQLPRAVAGQSGADLVDAIQQARTELERGRALSAYWKDWRHVALVSLAALVVPVVAVLLVLAQQLSPKVAAIGGLLSLVPVITATFRAATRWGAATNKELQSAQAAVQERLEAPVTAAQQALNAARDAAGNAHESLAQAEDELRLSQQQTADLDSQLKSLTPGRILVNFADQRSTEYGRRLGLLGHVRKDLADLEGSILDNNHRLLAGEMTPEGEAANDVPNRIVLYIDDLDRCPPTKVVDVLEAVHLLLAFELFVVVVAVDSRWLTSALVDRLIALQPHSAESDQPTTDDYLEKIFQVPFWVQPLASDDRKALVHGLLSGSVRAPREASGPDEGDEVGLRVGPVEEELAEQMLLTFGSETRPDTSPLLLEPADLALFESLAPLLGDTPRRVKRFVNTCQLLYAMAPPLTSGGGVDSERARVALLTAICDSSATIARRLLDGIEATRPQPGGPVTVPNSTTLSGLVDGLEPTCNREERERLTSWLREHPEWGAVSLDQFDVRLDMVRRLRFDRPAMA
jgi:hypothetical protein